MKALVVFYSRTGNTRKVGNKIAKILKADIDEIIDMKDRRGIIGWFVSGKDASQGNPAQIKNKLNPEKYDLLIIGTPVWAWTITPAIRAYLRKYNLKGKKPKIAFFCTCGGNSSKTFTEMQALSKKPLASLVVSDKKLVCSDKEIKEFCDVLR